jgi:hypothetical protein
VRAVRPVRPVRVVRPVPVVRPVVISAHVYRPWRGPFFGYPYFWGARGYWGYPGWAPYWWGPPVPVRYGPELAQARLKVSPRDTEVYVDGRLVGVVDDFDGRFQRLRLPPGRYRLELYREGTEPWSQAVLLTPGTTLDIEHVMAPLPAGAAEPARPVPPPSGPRRGRLPDRARGEGVMPGASREEAPADLDGAAVISLRVQPADATIEIGGEQWELADDDERLILHVTPGRHRIVVTADGYEPFESELEVEAGDSRQLNVSLSRR